MDQLMTFRAGVLTDTITNHGFGDRQVLYALHLNDGYPLLEEGCKLILDSLETIPREENAAQHLSTWQQEALMV